MDCLGSLSLSRSAILLAIAVRCLAESWSPLGGPPGRWETRLRSLGLMATFDGSYPVSATYAQPGAGADAPESGRISICGIVERRQNCGVV